MPAEEPSWRPRLAAAEPPASASACHQACRQAQIVGCLTSLLPAVTPVIPLQMSSHLPANTDRPCSLLASHAVAQDFVAALLPQDDRCGGAAGEVSRHCTQPARLHIEGAAAIYLLPCLQVCLGGHLPHTALRLAALVLRCARKAGPRRQRCCQVAGRLAVPSQRWAAAPGLHK